MFRLTRVQLLGLVLSSIGSMVSVSAAGTLTVQDLESAAADFLADSHAAGVPVAVAVPGVKEPLLTARGYSCVQHSTPMKVDDPMWVGSVTKLFTALRIRQYIDDGLLSYDTPLSRFYPNIKINGRITIRQLLDHTSGLKELFDLPLVRNNPARQWQVQALTKLILESAPDCPAGERIRYSNSGYLVLGEIIARLSGQTWEQETRQAIAIPLNMRQVRLADASVVPNEAHGYAFDSRGGWSTPQFLNSSFAYSAGGLVCGITDLLQLGRADRLLKKPWIDRRRLTPMRLSNGQPAVRHGLQYDEIFEDGLEQMHFPDGLVLIGKKGNYPGFSAIVVKEPVSGLLIAVMANQERVNGKLLDLIRRLCAAAQPN